MERRGRNDGRKEKNRGGERGSSSFALGRKKRKVGVNGGRSLISTVCSFLSLLFKRKSSAQHYQSLLCVINALRRTDRQTDRQTPTDGTTNGSRQGAADV